jgi:NADH-quinone oxidoreductase subunit N
MNVGMLDWLALAPSLIVLLGGILVVGIDLLLTPTAVALPHPEGAMGGHTDPHGTPHATPHATPLGDHGHVHALAPGRGLLVAVSFASILVPAVMLLQRLRLDRPVIVAFQESFVLDPMASYLSLAVLAATGMLLVSAEVDTRRRRIAFGEYYGLLLVCASSMMMLVGSNDFLMIFLNLEILSLALYVLTGITRRNPRSNEAAMKYLVTGGFATGFLLMGVAFLYGGSGSIALADIGTALAANPDSALLKLGFGFVLVGFGFKIGAVPFHMWVPDVYEGAPTTTTAFMSVTVKAASIGALIRVLLVSAESHPEIWADLLWWIAAVTMVLGNLLALQQSSVKRMLAYSSVAHTGYALVALATMLDTDGSFSSLGAASALFYLLVYTFMTLGAFMVLVYMGHEVGAPGHEPEWQDAEAFDDLAGMGTRHPWAALAMTLFLVSLGGIPPTAGFFGKFTIFMAAVERGHVLLAVIGVLASLVSLYYYLRVVVVMYMREPVATDEKPHASVGLAVGLAALGTVLLGVLPSTWWEWATRAIAAL